MTDPLVYTLAVCPKCGARYAALPDPCYPGQYEVMHRDTLGHCPGCGQDYAALWAVMQK